MSESDSQEKTQQPTPKRQQDAKDKGQIARSKELNTLLLLLASSGMLLMSGPHILDSLATIMQFSLQFNRDILFNTDTLLLYLGNAFIKISWAILPFFLVLVVTALFSPLLLGGWICSSKNLMPKAERISPIKGIKRMFSVKSLTELIKTILKFSLVLCAGIFVIYQKLPEILTLNNQDVQVAIYHGMGILGYCFLSLTCVLVIIAIIDVPFQLWEHNKKLKMSLQEVKDEMKQTETNPEIKGKIQRIQREMAQRRMILEIPKADVVVTNPTHYAVALRYDKDKNMAPHVVAKGADLMAAQIRQIATQHGVEIVSSPALARALYHSTELFQEIPQGLYAAVAQLLAYIYQLKNFKKGYQKQPQALGTINVPDEFAHD